MVFTAAAMFEAEEAFGGSNEMLSAISAGGKAGFDAHCKAVALLAEQGELVRRYMGYEPRLIIEERDIRAIMTPADVGDLTQRVISAVTLGYRRDVESHEDVDLGLIELEQKKTKG